MSRGTPPALRTDLPGDVLARLPDERLAHLVRTATRGFNRALQMRLSRHDVSFGHWVFLRILWARDGLTQRDLALRAGLTEPTAFSALTAMEKLGFVTREADPASRRTVRVRLTKRGRALQPLLVPLAEDVNRCALRGTTAADVAAARRVLLAAIANLAADEAEGDNPPMPSTRALGRVIEASAAGSRRTRSKRKEEAMTEDDEAPAIGGGERR
jgi:MarR family transcriptional regulator, organic hydroperoxide resistance regulator